MINVTKTALACSLVLASNVKASESDYPSLGCDSRNAIAFSALKGAAAGVAGYVAWHLLAHDFKLPRLSQHPYALAWAAVGATANALWAYTNTTESHFTYAKKGIYALGDNDLLNLILNSDSATIIQALKDFLFREKLPLYTSFRRLNAIYADLESYANSLNGVLSSSRTDLYQEATELQVVVEIYQNIIQEVFKQLRDDANFITECNAGTMEEIQHAQMIAAQAAQSAAFAQWSRPTEVVVINK